MILISVQEQIGNNNNNNHSKEVLQNHSELNFLTQNIYGIRWRNFAAR